MDEEENKISESAKREEETLAFWNENNIFEKTVKKDSPKGEFVFYEGPPTANGKPGIHHLEARSFKDAIPRYKTMQGFRVRRKAGWDTHGLPVELQVEKELGLKSKKEIENFGVAEFNKKCKESVLQYIDLWKKFTERIGYWTDFDNAYFTFDNNYIESVWNILSKVEEQKLLYKDYKVLPWCPRCGTALSSHELAQGYQDDKDLSVYAKFKVVGEENTFIIAWTTTPWTLPGNVALAVGEDVEYVKISLNNEKLILAKERLSIITEAYEVLETMKGKDLTSFSYEPLYPFLKEELEKKGEDTSKTFKVYPASFVTTTDGTGVVHTAVMYGQDDFVLGTEIGLPKLHTVREDGTFYSWCGFLADRFVKDEEVAVDIIKDLAHRGLLFKKEKYEHSYPHCWRCKTALIYYARDSWYIAMSKLRDKMVSENQKINWEPSYIKDGRFGEWLREIKDWAISRERYWGTPLPVWQTEDKNERIVVDSIDTLRKLSKKSGNKYFLMRHGEAEHNIKGVLSSDVEEVHHLTEKGRETARETAEKLKKENIDLIFYSPLTRTKETVEEVVKVLGDIKSIEDSRIREEEFGVLSGNPWSEFEKHYKDFAERVSKRYENLETLLEVKQRVGEFLYELENSFQNKNILIVTHDGPAKLMKCVCAGANISQIKDIYTPGENFLSTGDYFEMDFTPLPHNENYELDLHKPYIDEVVLTTQDGKVLTRVKEVMDVWFDSGAMPFAEDHYPFENKEEVETKYFPADFISEAIDQTRGWFYTLHAIGCLMDRGIAYKNVICLGHLLDKNGKKMSKSLGNIVDPWEMANKYGVDSVRLWMYSVNQPGESKNFDEKTVDEINKKVFNLLNNVFSFYYLYRDQALELHSYEGSNNLLDKWIVSRVSSLISRGTVFMDQYKLLEPVRLLRDFIDDLSTWYLRRSRDRMREGDKEAKQTLYFVLKSVSKFMAPFAPFFAESLYQSLKNEKDKESVHLEDWPAYLSINQSVEDEMSDVRKVVTMALEARQKANIKVRQPLRSLVLKKYIPEEYLSIIADEVNVKEVLIDSNIAEEIRLDIVITEELKEEGMLRELVRVIQDKRKTIGLSPNEVVAIDLGAQSLFMDILNKKDYLDILKRLVLAKEINLVDIGNDFITVEDQKISIEIKK